MTYRQVSEAPSYHSTAPTSDASPAYTPATNRAAPRTGRAARESHPSLDERSVGLPPIPPLPPRNTPSLHNFIRIATWSTTNAPVARHYRSVAERRVTDGRYQPAEVVSKRNNPSTAQVTEEENRREEPFRPLEDPYLVGEAAAAEARRDRIARETGDDILIKEDQQWDWLLGKNTPRTIPAQSEQSLTSSKPP